MSKKESFLEQRTIVQYIETEFAHIHANKARTEKRIELLTEYRTAQQSRELIKKKNKNLTKLIVN